ncbi:MAG: type VI secretion system membrane subunit TssM [Cupriavidus sp.]|nr:type VI secretion system membrane subunit TssM [Cupriavidus sp.]
MSNLKRFLAFLFSKQMLMAVAFVVAAAIIWWLGPFLAFGEYHPFGDAIVRGTAIALLAMLLVFLLLSWPVSPVLMIGVCLLLWHLGPLLAFGEARPLAPVGARLVLIGLIMLGYGVYGCYRLWLALRSNDELLKRFLRPKGERTESKPREDLRALTSIVGNAVRHLRGLRASERGVARLFENRRQMYALPWFMVLGSQGSGKTTAILNSGLEFPEPNQMCAASLRLQGSGTANCDWWFANEAVLIDTAGRYAGYAEQDLRDEAAMARNHAEWKALLGMLRKHRPRAPINGAVLTLSARELLEMTPDETTTLAAALRARMGELRQELGVRFPVYVLVTKLDVLPGFSEYFRSLTAEGRAQVWGFTLTLPAADEPLESSSLRERCAAEFRRIERRLDAGINNRLIEEFESEQRRRLYALPQEFRSLAVLLQGVVELIFLDSRYDDTQLDSALRGVYFSCAMQSNVVVAADKTTLLQQLWQRFAKVMPDGSSSAPREGEPTGYRSFFLHNLFRRVIVPEAHLVRPNLRWEFRFRAMRIAGYLASGALFLLLLVGMMVSFDNNRDYIAAISAKTDALAARVKGYRKTLEPSAMTGMLTASYELPQQGDLDLARPGPGYRYGLYSAPPIIDASGQTYASLLRQTLLPQVVRRMESVLDQTIHAGDPDAVYSTLSAYLMLHDQARFDAASVRAWVLGDWERADSSASLGDARQTGLHLESLFGGQLLTPGTPLNAELVERARRYLSSNPAPRRLYERAMADMAKEAPQSITLARAAGSQASSALTMLDDSQLPHGVPGLYTYDGYHKVFNKRLPQFLVKAQPEDAWVMGRPDAPLKGGFGQNPEILAARSPLADEIRQQYLADYAGYWQRFLGNVRPAFAGLDGRGGSTALDLNILRILSSADSPLVRLARTAVRETTLSTRDKADEATLKEIARVVIPRRAREAERAAGVAAMAGGADRVQRMERELVDNRFAALREVVTGQSDPGTDPTSAGAIASAGGGALQLSAIVGLLGEQHTRLSVATQALSSNSMPPAVDIGTTLRVEAEKLPAPFFSVLSEIAGQLTQEVNVGVGKLLAAKVESSVGAACRRAIEGKYPFSPGSTQEVDIEDFNQVFAAGGMLDDFFKTTLAPHVDMSANPWRYKPISAGMPAVEGPDLEPFQRAVAIRETFFREAGARRMSWKVDAKVVSVDPEILELALDVDGQSMRYVHGPITPFTLTWPGPRGGAIAEMTASPRIRPDTSTLLASGPWALFRLLSHGRRIETASASRMVVSFSFDGRHAALEFMPAGNANPLAGDLLADFTCPRGGV